MNKASTVHKLQSFHSLSSVIPHFWLLQPVAFFEPPEDITLGRKLSHDVEVLIFFEEAIKTYYVPMFEIVMDPQLFCHLMDYLLFTNNRLRNYLQGTQKVCLLVTEYIQTYITCQTVPNLPRPNYRIFKKSFSHMDCLTSGYHCR